MRLLEIFASLKQFSTGMIKSHWHQPALAKNLPAVRVLARGDGRLPCCWGGFINQFAWGDSELFDPELFEEAPGGSGREDEDEDDDDGVGLPPVRPAVPFPPGGGLDPYTYTCTKKQQQHKRIY